MDNSQVGSIRVGGGGSPTDEAEDPGGTGGARRMGLDRQAPCAPGDLSLTLQGPVGAGWVANDLEAWSRAVVALAAPQGGEVRVQIIDDAAMARAHQDYCGVSGTTDVITFDLADGESANGAPLDVDLLICADEAGRQAAERGHGVDRELTLYILHGVLHCMGYDDHDEDSYERMHAQEDAILERAGLGAVFARGGEDGNGGGVA